MYTCLYIIISICLLNVVNVLKECLKNPGIPQVGQHCIVHEGAQVKRVMTILA